MSDEHEKFECPVCGSKVDEMPLPATLTDGDVIAIRVRLLEMRAAKHPALRTRIAQLREWAEAFRRAAAAEKAKVS